MQVRMPNFFFASIGSEKSRIDFYKDGDKRFLYNGLIYNLNEDTNYFVNQYGMTMDSKMAQSLFDMYANQDTDQ